LAVKALIFGTDDFYPKLKPFYDKEVEKGTLEVVGYADPTQKDLKIYSDPDFSKLGGGGGGVL